MELFQKAYSSHWVVSSNPAYKAKSTKSKLHPDVIPIIKIRLTWLLNEQFLMLDGCEVHSYTQYFPLSFREDIQQVLTFLN